MPDWLSGSSLLWIAGAWVVMVAAAAIAIPVLLIRLPADYFRGRSAPPPRHWGWKIAKNVAGILVLLVGIAMLLLPGPGLLAVLAGVLLLDFPGKRRVEQWIMARKQVLAGANWLRRKAGRSPLAAP